MDNETWTDEQEDELLETRDAVPDLTLMLWFDLTPKTPLEWGVQPAALWVTAIAYQNAFNEGQEIERELHRGRQAAKQV